jgi:hypothetical protein
LFRQVTRYGEEHPSTSLARERDALTKTDDDQVASSLVGAILAVALPPVDDDQVASSLVEAILAVAFPPVNDDQTASSLVEAILAIALPPVNDDQTASSMVGATARIALAPASNHSLSIVLPAYNEEQVIAGTVSDILGVLSSWHMDFEVLVVNDGSTDRTGAIVSALADTYPQVRLVTHSTNQGYGAALVSGFTEATKELTFFMDSDGQFDIRDLRQFFSYIDEYDAVIGYRIDRQDSWMRKLNAWGWKLLIDVVLGVHVRDIDCAFKLLHTEFLCQYPLETRGAMINAELLYKLAHAGHCYREIGVHHHPRKGGRATGARPGVIFRALRELFHYARKWQRELQGTPYRSRV